MNGVLLVGRGREDSLHPAKAPPPPPPDAYSPSEPEPAPAPAPAPAAASIEHSSRIFSDGCERTNERPLLHSDPPSSRSRPGADGGRVYCGWLYTRPSPGVTGCQRHQGRGRLVKGGSGEAIFSPPPPLKRSTREEPIKAGSSLLEKAPIYLEEEPLRVSPRRKKFYFLRNAFGEKRRKRLSERRKLPYKDGRGRWKEPAGG